MAKVAQKYIDLKNFNIKMGILHFVQAVILFFISNDSTREITTSYWQFNDQTEKLEIATRTLFEVRFAWFIIVFLLLSSFFHLFVSTVGFKKYVSDLRLGMNRFRWFEYSISASVMMVAVAMLTGIFSLGYLLAIFTLVAAMNLTGYLMEVHNQTTEKTNWSSYLVGCLLGVVPWIAIALQLWGSGSASGVETGPPTFVYFIFFSIFIFFNCFAINMVLQYKKTGKWSDYLYGERVYIVLSLVAKSALAWQVYAGTLQPA